MKNLVKLAIVTVLVTSCSSNKQQEDGLPFIDVSKNYPEKEILLTGIADVTYLYLNSDDADYLYKGGIHNITENTVVVVDNVSSSILFFAKDGTAKSYFNHKGQGPGEYTEIRTVVYDETTDELFVTTYSMPYGIQVYSSVGDYKRTIKLPRETLIEELIVFDDHSLFFRDGAIEFRRSMALLRKEDLPADDYVIPFYRISKTDGEVLDYVELPGTHLLLGGNYNGRWISVLLRYSMKCPEGVLLWNAQTDTVFFYRGDKSLTPVIYQTPSVSSLNPMEYLTLCLDRGQYQFIQVTIAREGIHPGFFPVKNYLRDKKTGEIIRPKFLLPDYEGKEFTIDPSASNAVGKFYNEGYYFELNLYELKEADRAGKLSGQLKDLVATLDENNDNNVFMLVEFKSN